MRKRVFAQKSGRTERRNRELWRDVRQTPATLGRRLFGGNPISSIRNGGKSFFPLDPFLWLRESCFLHRQAGHAAPPAGARKRGMQTCFVACPAGGHAVTYLGRKAAGQFLFRNFAASPYQPSTGFRAEPWCSFPRLSPEKAGPGRSPPGNAAGHPLLPYKKAELFPALLFAFIHPDKFAGRRRQSRRAPPPQAGSLPRPGERPTAPW